MSEIRRLLELAGLARRGLEQKASIEIGLDEAAPTTAERTSRLGGLPLLPDDLEWPTHRWALSEIESWPTWARDELAVAREAGQVFERDGALFAPLPFLAQIDLSEVAPFDLEGLLPREGSLLFFAAQTIDAGDRPSLPFAKATSVILVDGNAAPREPPALSEPGPSGVLKWAPSLRLRLALTFEERRDLLATLDERGRAAIESSTRNEADALLPTRDGGLDQLPREGDVALLRLADRFPIFGVGDASWMTFTLGREALSTRAFHHTRAVVFAG